MRCFVDLPPINGQEVDDIFNGVLPPEEDPSQGMLAACASMKLFVVCTNKQFYGKSCKLLILH